MNTRSVSRKTLYASGLALATLATILCVTALFAQAGESASMGDADFYGRIDLGGAPQPLVVNREPILVERPWAAGDAIYLRVRPGQAEHWSQHCQKYFACDDPVYFVRDDWYSDVYAPQYRQRRDDLRDDKTAVGTARGG